MEWSRRNLPALLLAVAALTAAVVTLVLSWKLTFYADTWELLMNRRDPTIDALFKPHNEHWVLWPTVFSELSLRIFGMESSLPEYVLLTTMLVATAILLYVYVQRRVGSWFALYAAVLLLFLGPAFEVLLWPFETSFCGPVLCGLGMLLALERGDRRGDLLACALLVASLGFSSLALPFMAGAAVVIAQGRRETWLARAYVVVVPALVFAVWYLGWGHEATSHVSLRNAFAAPRYVAETIATAVGGLVGLGTNPADGSADPVWGRPLAVALAIGIAVWIYRKRSLYAGLWPVVAIAGTNWLLSALNAFPGREPTASRYQYSGAIFVLLILANLFGGTRPSRGMVVAGAVATVIAIAPNLVVLKQGGDFFEAQSALTKADTAALEIARDSVDPLFALTPENAGTPSLIDISAARYFEAVDEYGSPAYTVAELRDAPEPARLQADVLLGQALPLKTVFELVPYAAAAAAGCVAIAPGTPTEVPVADGSTVELAAGPPAELGLRRFAVGEFPVKLSSPEGNSRTELQIPRDRARQPWVLQVIAGQPARVCP